MYILKIENITSQVFPNTSFLLQWHKVYSIPIGGCQIYRTNLTPRLVKNGCLNISGIFNIIEIKSCLN